MSRQHQEHDQQRREGGASHSGGFAEAVDDPRDRAAGSVPKESEEHSRGAEKAALGIEKWQRLGQPGSRKQYGDDCQRHSNDKPQPMKSPRQPIHSIMLQFAATTCLFPRPPARGGATLTLASFALMAWVLLRGLL